MLEDYFTFMRLLSFLIIFPLLTAGLLLVLPWVELRRVCTRLAALVIACASLLLLELHVGSTMVYYRFSFAPEIVNRLFLFCEIGLTLYLIYIGMRFRRYLVCALALVQTALLVSFELKAGAGVLVEHNLFIDRFSLIMALIAGVIGGLIVLYANGYMQEFHKHYRKELKDRRRMFFPVVFIFLSAMFGIIFSNNLLWLYFFWEVTTVCSFFLISYKKTDESWNNAFRALEMNLLGGVAFAVSLVYLFNTQGVIELDKVMLAGKGGALLPIALLCFAGMVKSAQLPFSSWLTGAMVAPTPVSALLHSTTMVKAGVYLLLRLCSSLQGTMVGFMVALIGGLTFVIASFIAISQSDAKKILAYSTIANLGLIVMCAGVGTYEALWAGILLIIFHALAKSLLFLCVGTVEHKVHSRNVEAMEGLIISMPRISIMMQIGIAGMFLAPFGMLISKWAVLKALVDFNPLLAIFVIFGSAATLFFWVKWLGKLITVVGDYEYLESGIVAQKWLAFYSLAALTVGMCVFFPAVSHGLIEPYVLEIFGKSMTLSPGNLQIMLIMMGMLALFPLSFLRYGKRVKVVDPYLGGTNAGDRTEYLGTFNTLRTMEMKGYYLENIFGERRLLLWGAAITLVCVLAMFGAALL